MTDDQLSLPGVSAASARDTFDPARLVQARALKSLTKVELAALVGTSPAAIGQFEAGVTRPRAETVTRLAAALGQPVEFFAGGRPHARMDASMAHFRSLRRTRVSQRTKAVAFVEQVWELQHALECWVQLPDVDLPGYAEDPGEHHWTPSQAAKAVRADWGVLAGPLPHLVRTLEQRGVIVTLLKVVGDEEQANIDAFSTSRMPRPIVVLTPDRANDVFRSRFTAAHELGHLLLHRDVLPGELRQEREADEFAAELLTPLDQIAPELSTRVSLSKLQTVSRRWGVSVSSLLLRSKELGLISDVSVRRAYQRLNSQPPLPPEPIAMFPGETPSMLQQAFLLAGKQGLTVDALAGELRWTRERIEELLNLDPRPRLSLV